MLSEAEHKLLKQCALMDGRMCTRPIAYTDEGISLMRKGLVEIVDGGSRFMSYAFVTAAGRAELETPAKRDNAKAQP